MKEKQRVQEARIQVPLWVVAEEQNKG